MNHKALLHIQDSQYCYALNNNTIEIRLRVDSNDKFDDITLVYGNKYDYYLNQKRAKMHVKFVDENYAYYSLKLELDDVRFVYIFELLCEKTKYYFCEDGIKLDYDFGLAYYNSFQLPYINEIDVPKPVEWMKNAVFYQIFVDRFNQGDLLKNSEYINLPWGHLPHSKSFAGGDLQGITDKLDYLVDLGVTAIYLTPIFRSTSNHKYDIYDYYNVDEHFGDKVALKRLIDEAHKRNVKIILDAVFNHCSDKIEQFQDVLINGKNSKYFNWFIINGDKIENGNYEHFGVCKYMPKWNTSNIEVRKYLIDIALYWTKKFGIDGWRLDVADEVSHNFWRYFREEIKSFKSDCIILGENWHDSATFLRGEFDGIMNYALTKGVLDFFVHKTLDAQGLAQRLSSLYVRNTQTANSMMLNLLDSHDTHRFYTQVNKNIDVLATALAIIFMHTGSPNIFYGTEIPLEGGYDPDCRRTMDWSNSGNLCPLIKKLSELRKRNEIINGEISFSADGDLFVLERKEATTLKLVVNNNEKTMKYIPNGKVLVSHNFTNENVFSNVGFLVEEVK